MIKLLLAHIQCEWHCLLNFHQKEVWTFNNETQLIKCYTCNRSFYYWPED